VAAVAPAGSASVIPGKIKLATVRLLADSSAPNATPWRRAIPLSESPALTV
jgi:hypothetical protein